MRVPHTNCMNQSWLLWQRTNVLPFHHDPTDDDSFSQELCCIFFWEIGGGFIPPAWPPTVLLSKGLTAALTADKPSVWSSNAVTKLEERLAYSSTTLLMLPLSSRMSITLRVRLSGNLDSWFWLISLMSRRLWSSRNCTWEKLCWNEAHTLPWIVELFASLSASIIMLCLLPHQSGCYFTSKRTRSLFFWNPKQNCSKAIQRETRWPNFLYSNQDIIQIRKPLQRHEKQLETHRWGTEQDENRNAS